MKYKVDVVPCKRADNGKELYLTKYSRPASEPQKNILCLHGLTFSQHVFDIDFKDYSVARFLAKEGYHVWCLDAGGHGRSERYENGFDVNTESASKDVVTAIETINQEMGTEQIDLLGWSWGSMTTSMAAGLRPELVRKLVLVGLITGGTMPALPTFAFPDDKLPISYEFAARLFRHTKAASGAVSADADDSIDYDITQPEIVNLQMHNLFRYDLIEDKPMGPNIDVMCAGDKWLIDGDAIKCPTLLMKGTDDIYSSEERVEELLKKLPEGSEKCIVRGGGHGFFYEKDYYKKFQSVVLDFLNK